MDKRDKKLKAFAIVNVASSFIIVLFAIFLFLQYVVFIPDVELEASQAIGWAVLIVLILILSLCPVAVLALLDAIVNAVFSAKLFKFIAEKKKLGLVFPVLLIILRIILLVAIAFLIIFTWDFIEMFIFACIIEILVALIVIASIVVIILILKERKAILIEKAQFAEQALD